MNNLTNGLIHYMIVKRFLVLAKRPDLWNAVYHCADFENSDYIVIHSLYEMINSVDIDVEDNDIFKSMILYIIFECTESIIF